jgi:hypothetical protein
MKTQQRSFVVEIKSTRRRSKVAPKSIWGDTDFKALVREAEAEAPHLITHDIAAEASGQDADHAPNLEPQERPADLGVGEEQQVQASSVEVDQSLSQDEDLTSGVISQNRVDPPRQVSRRKSGRRHAIRLEHPVDEESDEPTVLPVVQSEPSGDEITALETENRHLKSLRAEQLRQQNLQLRKMLARFTIT